MLTILPGHCHQLTNNNERKVIKPVRVFTFGRMTFSNCNKSNTKYKIKITFVWVNFELAKTSIFEQICYSVILKTAICVDGTNGTNSCSYFCCDWSFKFILLFKYWSIVIYILDDDSKTGFSFMANTSLVCSSYLEKERLKSYNVKLAMFVFVHVYMCKMGALDDEMKMI